MRTAIKVVAAIAVLVASGPASAGYNCRGSFTSSGNTKLTKYGALKSAREVWQAQVRAQHGVQFSSWAASRGKSSDCSKSGVIFNYQCRVTARPCR